MKIKSNLLSNSKNLKNKVYSYFKEKTGAEKKGVDYLLTKHNKYGTFLLNKDKYICLFNIIDGEAHINHLIGNKCGIEGIREICSNIKEKFGVEYLFYVREFKKNSKSRKININRFIK